MRLIPTQGLVGPIALREAATSELTQIIGLVRAALQARFDAAKKPGDSYVWFDVEAMYPDRAIVCKDGRYWQFGYTLSADNQVTLAEPVEVVEEFTPVSMRESIGADQAFIEATDEGKVWDVVILRAGKSLNGFYYSDATLREAVALFEGARVLAKSNDVHLKGERPDINKVAGWISDVKFVEGAGTDAGSLRGKFNMVGQVELREAMVEAWKRGKKDLVGLSIDATGKSTKPSATQLREGVKAVAKSITKVLSVDLIVDPSAGGGLVRLVESADPKEQSEMALKDKMKAKVKAKFPAVDVEALDDDALEQRYAEAVAADVKPAPQAQQQAASDEPVTREELRMIECRAGARVTIAEAKLPQAAKDKLLADFTKRERFVEADVEAAIKGEREYLARFTESGRVQLGELADIEVEDRSKKMNDMLDAFFDRAHKEHRSVQSFRECYIELTGDARVTGRLENCDRTRMAESLGSVFRESLDSSALANVLGSSLRRSLLRDYRDMGQYDIWRQAADVVPVADFRTNERTRFGGYGDLPAVAEGDAYAALTSPTDEKATYAVSKRGGTEDVTLEQIKNDDVGAIRRVPVKLARAAKRTLAKFVLDFVRTNPTLYDSVAFFHATHGNLGANALDATYLAAARLRMLKQTEAGSSDRLGIGPKYVWVSPDGQEAAENLFNRNTNLDKTFINNLSLQVMPVWYWTDTNDWAISADVMDIPGIEIGFLDGNEEPELFVQDNPTFGSMFANDKLTWKIRHIYGGQVVEFRGWDKSVV